MNAVTQRRVGFVFPRAVMALMLREMSTTYGRSPGGYLWSIAEPTAGIIVMTIVFTMIAHHPPLGSSFPLFYATGLLPLQMYQNISNKVASAIRFSKPLLAYPNVSYIDTIVARLLLESLTQFLVFFVVLFVIIEIEGARVDLNVGAIGLSFAMLISMGLGIGLMNCFLTSMFPVWQFTWAVLNRPMFLISGVLFVVDTLSPVPRGWMLWNPLTHVISMMRKGFYGTYGAPYASPVYVFGVALLLSVIGLLLVRRFHRHILDERV
ncbi:ABC transporter permease [Paenirhodobacter sp.]|uniref:ABC transporter permease n=1 Tax=Paenirhodobacter sp. TaxID=1965326 RepID=UPI003B50DBB1